MPHRHFELHVLLAMIRLGGEACSVPLVTGRVRRYLKPTKQGLRVLKEARGAHSRLWQGLGRLLGKA